MDSILVLLALALCCTQAYAARLPFSLFSSFTATSSLETEQLQLNLQLNDTLDPAVIEARRSLAGSSGWPSPSGSVKLSDTIMVAAGDTFNGNMQMYYGIGNGGQGESQPPMFQVGDGGKVINVIIGSPAGDGIHCMGSCVIDNVWWNDVGEDAATLKGSDPSQVMVVQNGGAKLAADKVFQHDGPGTFIIRNFYADTFGKLWRACGNCKEAYQRKAIIENVVIQPPFMTLAGVNIDLGDSAKISGVKILGSDNSPLCIEFHSAPSGSEPKRLSSTGPDQYCQISGALSGSGGSGSSGSSSPTVDNSPPPDVASGPVSEGGSNFAKTKGKKKKSPPPSKKAHQQSPPPEKKSKKSKTDMASPSPDKKSKKSSDPTKSSSSGSKDSSKKQKKLVWRRKNKSGKKKH